LLKLLLACEIDFALASRPIHDERLEALELFSEELLIAVPLGHPLAQKRAVNAKDLEGERLIVMKEGHCLGDQVLGFCDRHNLHHRISFRSAQLETIQSLVRGRAGDFAHSRDGCAARRQNGPAYRSLNSTEPSRQIVAVWRGNVRPDARRASF